MYLCWVLGLSLSVIYEGCHCLEGRVHICPSSKIESVFFFGGSYPWGLFQSGSSYSQSLSIVVTASLRALGAVRGLAFIPSDFRWRNNRATCSSVHRASEIKQILFLSGWKWWKNSAFLSLQIWLWALFLQFNLWPPPMKHLYNFWWQKQRICPSLCRKKTQQFNFKSNVIWLNILKDWTFSP